MPDITSIQSNVILHIQDGHPIAATIANGSIKLYKLTEMARADVEKFYGADKASV
jgi:hypothetical protein